VGFADDNPRLLSYPPNKIMGFRGLDTKSKAPNINDGRAADLLNVRLSSAFDLKKRYGFSVVNNTLDDFSFSSPAVTGLFMAEFSTGNELFAFVGNKLKYDNEGTWSDVIGTATITTGANYQWVCITALDNGICTNNQDPPIDISSVPGKQAHSFSSLAVPVTKAQAIIWFRNYLIVGNTYEGSTRKTRFRWSDVGTISTWSEENYVDISSLSGDEIISFKEMYGELYIIMRKSIWKASLVGGDDIFVFAKLVDGIGAISPQSVQVISFPQNKQGIVFLTEDKKVQIFNGVTVEDMGTLIQPNLDNISASRIQYSASIFDGIYYYLSVTDGSGSENDTLYVYNVEINEWSKYDNVNANIFARVKTSASVIKTYFGNYDSFVYWLDDPDQVNDVVGAIGIVDSIGTYTSASETNATVIIDSALPTGDYTGATVRITGGTGEGEESVIMAQTSTSLVVTTAPSTTYDSTSSYSIGDINAYYKTKWYDFADAARQKMFRAMYFWAKEDTANQINISYSEDYGAQLGSTTIDLAPSSTSLWDSAIWDESVWGSSGDKFYTTLFKGRGRVIQVEFSQKNIDEDFHIYGFHLIADKLDIQ